MLEEQNMKLQQGPVPLYHQLAQDLREQIHKKKLKNGDALPTEEQLCKDYSVSRITVRRALDDLISEKLVVRKRGVGTFVGSNQEASRSVSLTGSLYDALSYPKNIVIEMLDKHIVKPPSWVTEALNFAATDKAYHCQVLSRLEALPFAYTNFYFPLEIGENIPFSDLDKGTPVARLVERVIEEPVVRAEQTVVPELADAKTATLLDIRKNTPLLHVLRTYYTASGRPVETVSVRYHPDQYQLKIELLPGK
jgi:GntR family transcriptional regulator